MQKRDPFGGHREPRCTDALLAESSQRFDGTKHFSGRMLSGRCDEKMAVPHEGDSKSTLTAAGIDYDGTP